MIFSTLHCTLVGAFALWIPCIVSAQWNEPVAAGKPAYSTLMRLVCSKLQYDEKEPLSAAGSGCVPHRMLDGGPPDAWTEADLKGVSKLKVNAGTSSRVVLSFLAEPDVQRATEIALFETAPSPRLVDWVEAMGFPNDPLSVSEIFAIATGTDAVVLTAYHHNSQQGYALHTVFFVSGDRIVHVETIPLLSCHGCQHGDFEEDLKFSTLPDASNRYRQVVARVVMKRDAGVHVYSTTYRWNQNLGRYQALSPDIANLKAFNERNY